MAERVTKYTKTEIFSGINAEKKLTKHIRSPFYKHHTALPSEDSKSDLIELVMDQKKVTDDKLVHVGVAILQESKLLFLRFVQFLREFLISGSYQPIYCGKIKLDKKNYLKIIFRHRQFMLRSVEIRKFRQFGTKATKDGKNVLSYRQA